MKTKLILVAALASIFCSNLAFGQFHWSHPLKMQGFIQVNTYPEGVLVVVEGSAASDRVEVESIGSNAIVYLFNNERLVDYKWISHPDQSRFSGNEIQGLANSTNSVWGAPRRNRKELYLDCNLKGGNDEFSCDSPIFDLISVAGGDGDDKITAGPSAMWAFGENGNDSLDGGDNRIGAYLSGGAGNDFIVGGKGDDWLFGGFGSDLIIAHSQYDTDGSDYVVTFGYSAQHDEDVDNYWVDTTDVLEQSSLDRGFVTQINN